MTSYTGNTVSVLLQRENGFGHFASATTDAISKVTEAVSIGDLNGDGNPGLAVGGGGGVANAVSRSCYPRKVLAPSRPAAARTTEAMVTVLANDFEITLPPVGAPQDLFRVGFNLRLNAFHSLLTEYPQSEMLFSVPKPVCDWCDAILQHRKSIHKRGRLIMTTSLNSRMIEGT